MNRNPLFSETKSNINIDKIYIYNGSKFKVITNYKHETYEQSTYIKSSIKIDF